MYKSHTALIEPADDTVLWRYMDFTKFVAILETNTLFFPRLSELDDPFEGQLPRPAVEKIMNIAEGLTEAEREERRRVIDHNVRFFQEARSFFCISSWHMNDEESAAMWNIYLKSGDGIAIQTDFSAFKAAVAKSPIEVNGGKVQYVDYYIHDIDPCMTFNWVILKRRSFDHEREFRGVILGEAGTAAGTALPVCVPTLIKKIYVAPSSPEWVGSLITSVSKRYGLDVEVVHSDILQRPTYFQFDRELK